MLDCQATALVAPCLQHFFSCGDGTSSKPQEVKVNKHNVETPVAKKPVTESLVESDDATEAGHDDDRDEKEHNRGNDGKYACQWWWQQGS
jgi:hypothetical protein